MSGNEGKKRKGEREERKEKKRETEEKKKRGQQMGEERSSVFTYHFLLSTMTKGRKWNYLQSDTMVTFIHYKLCYYYYPLLFTFEVYFMFQVILFIKVGQYYFCCNWFYLSSQVISFNIPLYYCSLSFIIAIYFIYLSKLFDLMLIYIIAHYYCSFILSILSS